MARAFRPAIPPPQTSATGHDTDTTMAPASPAGSAADSRSETLSTTFSFLDLYTHSRSNSIASSAAAAATDADAGTHPLTGLAEPDVDVHASALDPATRLDAVGTVDAESLPADTSAVFSGERTPLNDVSLTLPSVSAGGQDATLTPADLPSPNLRSPAIDLTSQPVHDAVSPPSPRQNLTLQSLFSDGASLAVTDPPSGPPSVWADAFINTPVLGLAFDAGTARAAISHESRTRTRSTYDPLRYAYPRGRHASSSAAEESPETPRLVTAAVGEHTHPLYSLPSSPLLPFLHDSSRSLLTNSVAQKPSKEDVEDDGLAGSLATGLALNTDLDMQQPSASRMFTRPSPTWRSKTCTVQGAESTTASIPVFGPDGSWPDALNSGVALNEKRDAVPLTPYELARIYRTATNSILSGPLELTMWADQATRSELRSNVRRLALQRVGAPIYQDASWYPRTLSSGAVVPAHPDSPANPTATSSESPSQSWTLPSSPLATMLTSPATPSLSTPKVETTPFEVEVAPLSPSYLPRHRRSGRRSLSTGFSAPMMPRPRGRRQASDILPPSTYREPDILDINPATIPRSTGRTAHARTKSAYTPPAPMHARKGSKKLSISSEPAQVEQRQMRTRSKMSPLSLHSSIEQRYPASPHLNQTGSTHIPRSTGSKLLSSSQTGMRAMPPALPRIPKVPNVSPFSTSPITPSFSPGPKTPIFVVGHGSPLQEEDESGDPDVEPLSVAPNESMPTVDPRALERIIEALPMADVTQLKDCLRRTGDDLDAISLYLKERTSATLHVATPRSSLNSASNHTTGPVAQPPPLPRSASAGRSL